MENAISILEIPNTDIHAYFLHMKLRKTQLSNEYRSRRVRWGNGKATFIWIKKWSYSLDGVTIRGIRECEFSIKENDSLAELSLKMDVRTLGNEFATQFDGALNETGRLENVAK